MLASDIVGSEAYRIVELIGLSMYIAYVAVVIWWLLAQEIREHTA